ncbi:CHRD domain-containing protein [Corallincola platygyrae]|uniref:CHRD domain-containing protein n=1 Tax=Corallincola platygyrae TaxID=1193278 RepID=A0ABW4XRA1_9GAMM
MIARNSIKTLIGIMMLGMVPFANAGLYKAVAYLDYAQEVSPSNPLPSSAMGYASLVFDSDTLTLDMVATIQGIALAGVTFPDGGLAFGVLGPFHIHNAPAGANGGVVVPFNMMSYFTGAVDGLMVQADDIAFDASILTELVAGNLYLNLHTLDYGSGEIRGQLSVVPAPAAVGLLALGIFGLMRLRSH